MALAAGLLLALGYVGQNTLTGDRGLLALIDKREEIRALESNMAALEIERTRLARDVQLLSPPYVDFDILDERARSELGYARDGELVIFRDQD